jgi:cytochrome c553
LAIAACITFGIFGIWGPARADEAATAKLKAMQLCANCHGPQGLATMPRTPHLAGQDQDYLVEQLIHYRSGRRHHAIMSLIAKTLSDQDIVLTSNWYSSLRISVEDRK